MSENQSNTENPPNDGNGNFSRSHSDVENPPNDGNGNVYTLLQHGNMHYFDLFSFPNSIACMHSYLNLVADFRVLYTVIEDLHTKESCRDM